MTAGLDWAVTWGTLPRNLEQVKMSAVPTQSSPVMSVLFFQSWEGVAFKLWLELCFRKAWARYTCSYPTVLGGDWVYLSGSFDYESQFV